MLSILGFLIVLGPLVVFHEFGHYIFARLFNVKAEIFSIGFGPKLWSKQLGETELRVSAIPLGGYVKLLGEEPDSQLSPEDQKRALQRQAPWKRFFIFLGGPLFNFILAVLVFMAILVIGEPQLASVVGRVVSGSAAEKIGFQSGDKITAVNDAAITKFEELVTIINEHPNKPVKFDVQRETLQGAEKMTLTATPSPQEGYSVYGENTHVGEIEGLLPNARGNQVGVSNPNSVAGKAGVHTGDRLVAWMGKPVANWESIETLYKKLPKDSEFRIEILKASDGKSRIEMNLRKPAKSRSLGQDFGLYSSEMFIERTVPDSPAAGSGLKSGDRVVAIGGEDVESFFALRDAVQRTGEKVGKTLVKWERDGKLMTADIVPNATSGRDPALKKTTQYTIGIVPMLVWAEPSVFTERVLNPFMLVYKATERMAVFSWRNLVSMRKMVTGDVSIGTLGGPILIGKIAGESLSRGLIAFLTTMAILSVGLGVLNLLPVPVLDGGHLMLLTIEWIRGKPLTIRQMEIIQQVGLSLILLLMVIVIRNDLARLPFFE